MNASYLTEKGSMFVYYEFVCAGAPMVGLVTAKPEPAHIPAAAQQCCREWRFKRSFRLGDGEFPTTIEQAIESHVAAEGYYLIRRSTGSDPRSASTAYS